MLIQTQRWEEGTVRSNYSLTATSHPRPPPSLYRLSRWAAGLAKCDSNHLLLSWTSSISNWSPTAVNVLSSWAHPHPSKPHIAFHYNCRLNTDGLGHIFTGSNSGTTTGKLLITFSHVPIVATTATQTDILGKLQKMWSRLSALEGCHTLWKWSFNKNVPWFMVT